METKRASQQTVRRLDVPVRVRRVVDILVFMFGVAVALAGFFSDEVTWALIGV